ncbi:MAG: helix-turn-helix domain-containing protein [Terriglobia bacterium]
MDKRIEGALEIIRSEYQKPLRVTDLAKRVGLSRSHLAFLFKKESGVTFKACLREERLNNAVKLLGGDYSTVKLASVKQAAYSVGYLSVSSFGRDFKRRFGENPSQPQITQMAQIRHIQEW